MTTRARFVLVTDNPASWSVPGNQRLVSRLEAEGYAASLVHSIAAAPDADVAIYLSCERIIPAVERARFRHNLVVHASDLPRGRGWSPLSWQILEGREQITVTLFEAADAVDAGPIYRQRELRFAGHELIAELREQLGLAIEELVLEFARAYPDVTPRVQEGEPTFYARRRPADSRLDPDKPLRELFPQLRIADNDRYPAFFEHAGHIYELRIEKRGPVDK
ncbi:MAG: formyltransferase family protein [Kofleriaceae bacterium]